MDLKYERALVKSEILKAVDAGSEPVDSIVRYAVLKTGKLYRPFTLLLTAEAYGEELNAAARAGAAIELGNVSSLVLDDIADGAEERRGRETCHRKYGVEAANMAALQLIFHAETLAATATPNYELNSELVKVMNRSAREAIVGEMANVSCNGVLPWQAVKIAKMKTGSLYAASMVMGGLIGKAAEREIVELEKAGYDLGIGFQIKDDITDIVEDCGNNNNENLTRPNIAKLLGIHKAVAAQQYYSDKAISRVKRLAIKSERLEKLMREIA